MTKEQLLEAIRHAFYDGMKAGQVEYGDESFNPEDYLPNDNEPTQTQPSA